ncbi:MAG: LysR substrate-binding domain-containing protein [Geminicoccales bacterium]
MGSVLTPVLAAFRQTYPNIAIEISISERLVDIIRDGFHAGIRTGDRLSPSMVP